MPYHLVIVTVKNWLLCNILCIKIFFGSLIICRTYLLRWVKSVLLTSFSWQSWQQFDLRISAINYFKHFLFSLPANNFYRFILVLIIVYNINRQNQIYTLSLSYTRKKEKEKEKEEKKEPGRLATSISFTYSPKSST